MSVAQYQILLRDKLNIRNTAFISFLISKTIAMLIAEMRPHFLAHFTHFSLHKSCRHASRRHDSAAHLIKL